MATIELTVGTSKQYADIAAAWAAIPADVVASGNQYAILLAKQEHVISATLTLNGKTTSATNRITIKPEVGASYTENPDLTTVALAYNAANGAAIKGTGSAHKIVVDNANVDVIGLQLLNTAVADYTLFEFTANGTGGVMDKCILDSFANGNNSRNVTINSACTVRNTVLVYRSSNTAVSCAPITTNGASSLLENITMVRPASFSGTKYAIRNTIANTITVRNSVGINFTSLTQYATYGSHNAITSATAISFGTNNLENLVAADLVVEPSTDFRLKDTSPLINAGTATSSENSTTITGSRSQGTAVDIGAWEKPSTASTLTLSGPASGFIGYPDTLTVASNGSSASTITVTFSDNGGGGTFSVNPVTIAIGASSAQTQYTANSSGSKNITITSSPVMTITGPLAYSASQKPPSGSVTSQPSPVGQSLSITFSTADTPTSALATLAPSATNPNGAVSKSGVVTLGTNTGTATWDAIHPGNYQPTITVTNAGGSGSVSGLSAVSIGGIEGEVSSGDGTAPSVSVPGIPTNVIATAFDGYISVTCTPPTSDGGSAITGYKATASTGQTVTQATLPIQMTLPNNIAVTVQMQAINSVGTSAMSAPSNTVIPTSTVTVPGAPVNVTATAGPTRITVNYDAPASNGGSPIIDYTTTLSTGEQATSLTTTAVFNGLEAGVSRTATVRARNSAGQGPASSASNPATPTAPVSEVTGINILPQIAVVQGGQVYQFAHVVLGTNSPSQVGIYSATLGVINANGQYVAPDATVVSQVASVTVTSQQDPSYSATAIVTIPAVAAAAVTPVRHYDGNVTNNFGVAIEGAYVTVTNTDSGEKAELWKDKAMTDKLENPLITDDQGYFQFYVEATQCSYTVRGPGIKTYTRNDIFDIINNVDLSPIQTAIEALDAGKVSIAQLSQAVLPLAPRTSVTVVEESISVTRNGLSELTSRTSILENSNVILRTDVDTLKEKVNGISVQPPVDVKRFASAGNGTSASPWTGWDTAITWTAGVQYDFDDGFYDYNSSPNFAKNFLRIRGRKNAVLRHKGTGPALNVDAGSADGAVVVGMEIEIKVQGNSGSSNGLYLRGISQSVFNIEFNDVPGVIVQEVSSVQNNCRYVSSATQRTRTIQPATLLRTGRRNTHAGCAGNKYDLIAENCSSAAVIFDYCLNSKVNLISQFNDVGLDVKSTSKEITFQNFVIANNTTEDLRSAGENCAFNNGRVSRSATFSGARTTVVGGVYDQVNATGKNSVFNNLSYGSNGGLFNEGALGIVRNNVFNLRTNQFDDNSHNPLKSLTVRGNTELGAGLLLVGEGQITKLPNGQVGFGAAPVGANRLSLVNPNNTTTDTNLYSALGVAAYAATGTHLHCNSNGVDVLKISGVGNVTNLNNSYGAISDIRLKKNIVDASDKLAKLLAVRVVNYELIEGNGEKLLGVVADELESIFPGMVEVDANGFKSVKYSVFTVMLVKAIQELNAKIDAK